MTTPNLNPTAIVILGDCRAQLAKVPDETVDLVFTSPPYADRRANTYGGIKPKDYAEWFRPIAAEIEKSPQADGHVCAQPERTRYRRAKAPAIHRYSLQYARRRLVMDRGVQLV